LKGTESNSAVMPSDVKDIMGLSRPAADGPLEQKPKAKEVKAQRPAGMSREAYALLGDLHPITPTALANELKKSDDKVLHLQREFDSQTLAE
jgi:hypothetical protein